MRFYVCLVLLLTTLNAYSAVHISSVTRDLDYPDIFSYKEKVIGKPKVNKFDFPDKFDPEKLQPEYFWVKIRSDKSERNRNVKVMFTYKSRLSQKVETKIQNITLEKSIERVRFWWSASECESKGRVEIWDIKVLDGKEVLAETHCKAGTCDRF
mgnify:CR=1 FL=1